METGQESVEQGTVRPYEVLYDDEDCKVLEFVSFNLFFSQIDLVSLSQLLDMVWKELPGLSFNDVFIGGNDWERLEIHAYFKADQAAAHRAKRLWRYRVSQDGEYKGVEFLGRTSWALRRPTLADLIAAADKEFPGTPYSEVRVYLTLPPRLKGTGYGPTDVVGLTAKAHT